MLERILWIGISELLPNLQTYDSHTNLILSLANLQRILRYLYHYHPYKIILLVDCP